MSYKIKRNDSRALLATLRDEQGPVDLTDAAVKFAMRQREGSKQVSGDAELVDAPSGRVKYEWQDGDTDKVGIFDAEFQATFSDDTVQTFPNDGYLIINVLEDLITPP